MLFYAAKAALCFKNSTAASARQALSFPGSIRGGMVNRKVEPRPGSDSTQIRRMGGLSDKAAGRTRETAVRGLICVDAFGVGDVDRSSHTIEGARLRLQ